MKLPLSAASLVLANLIPAIGVLFFNWDPVGILFLYWAESAVIGIFTLAKILLSKGNSFYAKGTTTPMDIPWAKYPLALFFMFHFGLFMLVHLIFLMVIFLTNFLLLETVPFSVGSMTIGIASALVFIAALFISHGISFKMYYLDGKEFETANPVGLMFAPYPRIFVMQVAILLGFSTVFPSLLSGGNPGGLKLAAALMTLLKTAIDLAGHLLEHKIAVLDGTRIKFAAAGKSQEKTN